MIEQIIETFGTIPNATNEFILYFVFSALIFSFSFLTVFLLIKAFFSLFNNF